VQLVDFFFAHVSPDFIGLYVLYWDIDDQTRHNPFAALTGQDEGLHDGVLAQAGNPHRGTNRISFDYELHSQ